MPFLSALSTLPTMECPQLSLLALRFHPSTVSQHVITL